MRRVAHTVKVDQSIELRRPVADVFAYVVAIEHVPEWASGVVEARQTSAGAMGVGATLRLVAEALGQRASMDAEVTEYEPERRLLAKATNAPVAATVGCRFAPVPQGTRLTLDVTASIDNPLMRLAERQFAHVIKSMMGSSLRHLQQRLEGTT